MIDESNPMAIASPAESAPVAAPENAHRFETRSVMKASVEEMQAFHESEGAFKKLAPPPIFIQVHRDDRKAFDDGEIEFTMWFLFVPIRWIVCHYPGPTEHSFGDYLVKGPMAYWWHEHIFEPHEDGVELIDRITIAHKPGLPGLISRLIFDGLPLRIFFFYRHMRTRFALERGK